MRPEADEIEIVPPKLWPHQRKFVDDAARFTVCKSATKCGKTTASAWWLAREAARTPGGLFWWVGPTNDVGLLGFKTVQHLLEPLIIKNESRPWKFYLENQACVSLKTAQEPQHLMGAGVNAGVLDEAGLPEYDKAYPNILTTLSATNGRLKIIGNPGDAGSFFDKAERWGLDDGMPDWSFHRWKYLDRPTATQEALDDYRMQLGEDSIEYRRYYLGETIKGAGVFFHNLDAVCVAKFADPVPGERYMVGVDPCNTLGADYFVASVFNIRTRTQVYFSRHKGTPTEQQEEEIDRVARIYNDAAIAIETNGAGQPIARNLMIRGRAVYPFQTSGKSKGEALNLYRSDIAHSAIRLLDDETQKAEHLAFQSKASKFSVGAMRYGAPHGGHDDFVMANAIANDALGRCVNLEVVWAS